MHTLNVIPMHYPSDWQRWDDCHANNWHPREIDMGTDRLHFEAASPLQRHIARTNLANLTTADVQIMDNVDDGLRQAMLDLDLAPGPETRMMLAMQAYQERLHTRSYQHILETIGMDPEAQRASIAYGKPNPACRPKSALLPKSPRALPTSPTFTTSHPRLFLLVPLRRRLVHVRLQQQLGPDQRL